MAIGNKPQSGQPLVGDPMKGGGLPAKAPFQQFLDELVDLVNTNESGLADTLKLLLDFIALADTLYSVAAYGGLRLSVPTGIPNISAGFQTIPFDAVSVTTPRLVIQDIVDDTLTIERIGIWQISISFSIEFIDLNAGRTFDLQLYDTTDNAVVLVTTIFVGRNQAGTNYSVSTIIEVLGLRVGHPLSIRLGNASIDFTAVVLDNVTFSLVHVSERNIGE